MAKTWNLSYGYALLEEGIPEERVIERIAAWFPHDCPRNGVDVGAANLVTEKAYEVIRKWRARDKSTNLVSHGIWVHSAIYVYTSEPPPWHVRPGELAYIRRYRFAVENGSPYTRNVKVRVVGWVPDPTNGVLNANCIVTGKSIQYPRWGRVTVPVDYIRPRD